MVYNRIIGQTSYFNLIFEI